LLPEAVDIERSIPAEVTVEDSSLHDISSNVVITQLDPSGENVHPTVIRETNRLESEGIKRNNNAPGH